MRGAQEKSAGQAGFNVRPKERMNNKDIMSWARRVSEDPD